MFKTWETCARVFESLRYTAALIANVWSSICYLGVPGKQTFVAPKSYGASYMILVLGWESWLYGVWVKPTSSWIIQLSTETFWHKQRHTPSSLTVWQQPEQGFTLRLRVWEENQSGGFEFQFKLDVYVQLLYVCVCLFMSLHTVQNSSKEYQLICKIYQIIVGTWAIIAVILKCLHDLWHCADQNACAIQRKKDNTTTRQVWNLREANVTQNVTHLGGLQIWWPSFSVHGGIPTLPQLCMSKKLVNILKMCQLRDFKISKYRNQAHEDLGVK